MGTTLSADFTPIFTARAPVAPEPPPGGVNGAAPLDTITLESLAEHRIWVAWQLQPNDKGKPTKVPYSPTGPGKAEANNRGTWGDKGAG